MRCWADEIESTPIRATVLDPGRMRTRLRAQAYPGEDPETLPHPSEIAPLIVDLARRKDARIIDLNASLSDEDGLLPEVTWDGLHLNSEGFRRWREAIETAVTSTGDDRS